jgi:hypothetical protein
MTFEFNDDLMTGEFYKGWKVIGKIWKFYQCRLVKVVYLKKNGINILRLRLPDCLVATRQTGSG